MGENADERRMRELLNVLNALQPMKPRPMQPASHELYRASLNATKLHSLRNWLERKVEESGEEEV